MYSIPDGWKVDHLFVLIGGNLLPNYIAAETLLNEGGKLHAVFSPGTQKVAERLRPFFDFVPHQITDPGDGPGIASVIKTALAACDKESVGLHYTGGTKAMSVHAYAAVKRVRPDAVCTYLDSRTFSLRCGDQPSIQPNVQHSSEVDLKLLAELQGVPFKESELKEDVRFDALNQALAEAYSRGKGALRYEEWIMQVKQGEKQPNEAITLSTAGSLTAVNQQIQKQLGASSTNICLQSVVDNPEMGFSTVRDLVQYLDGGWLECLTLKAFQNVPPECAVDETAMTIKTDPDAGALYVFEYDIAAMQGARLFATSCTRSQMRDRCKSKLFEAYVRATQLGGDEARVGLVCGLKDPEILEREIEILWDADKKRFKVFGCKDLPDLTEKIRMWMLT